MSGQHTPEPWEYGGQFGRSKALIRAGLKTPGESLGIKRVALVMQDPLLAGGDPKANGERIVACVNHCAGFGTDTIAAGPSMAELVSEYGQAAELRAERDRLREAGELLLIIEANGVTHALDLLPAVEAMRAALAPKP